MNPREEWHITVEHDKARTVFSWFDWCVRKGVKPLYIELSNFNRQLMLAAGYDVSYAATEVGGYKVVRVKREVEAEPNQVVDGALYYECHVKIDGEFVPHIGDKTVGVSRDLYRPRRWYVTRRQPEPFEPLTLVALTAVALPSTAKVVGHEYEACLVDTNRELDAGWP